MKGILRFNLDDVDDKHAFDLACNAQSYQSFIFDFSQQVLRKYYKYGLPDELKDGDKLLEHIHKQFHLLFGEYNLQEPR